jgi:hypothetical protein
VIYWVENIDLYRVLEVLGVCAAASATFFTALTAIRIAQRSDEIRLKISVSDGLILDGMGHSQDIVWISITNVARRAAVIRAVGWKLSSLNKTELYQKVDPPNDPVPKKLEDGDTYNITIPVTHRDEREDWYEMFAKQFQGFGCVRRWFKIRRLRLQVFCSTGERFLARPSQSFRNRVKNAVELAAASNGKGEPA